MVQIPTHDGAIGPADVADARAAGDSAGGGAGVYRIHQPRDADAGLK